LLTKIFLSELLQSIYPIPKLLCVVISLILVGIPVTLKTPVLLSMLKLVPTFIPPRVEEEAIGSSLVGISYVLPPIYKYLISPIKAISPYSFFL